jgi:hypothetical protein
VWSVFLLAILCADLRESLRKRKEAERRREHYSRGGDLHDGNFGKTLGAIPITTTVIGQPTLVC